MLAAVDVVPECRPSAELQANFGFRFGLDQRLARPQKMGDEFDSASDGRLAIAALIGDFDGGADKLSTTRDVCRPRHDLG